MNDNFSRKLALAALFAFVPAFALAMGGRPQAGDEEATNARIQPVAKLKLAPASAATAGDGERTGEDLYNAVCMACHAAGIAGAPKIGDKGQWAPRIATGLDAMLKVVLSGKGAMPPKGGSDATEEELKRAVVFMANQSGGSF
jgi:cytochrome c5